MKNAFNHLGNLVFAGILAASYGCSQKTEPTPKDAPQIAVNKKDEKTNDAQAPKISPELKQLPKIAPEKKPEIEPKKKSQTPIMMPPPEPEVPQIKDDNQSGAVRYWTDAASKPILTRGEFLEVIGDQAKFKDHETGATVTFKLSQLSPGDVQFIKHWGDPTKRVALRKFGRNVQCNPDGSIDMMLSQAGCTDNDLKLFASLPEIVAINLYQCRISDEGLSKLVGLKNLRHLDIEENDIKGPGFRYLAELTNLESLSYSPDRGGMATITTFTRHLAKLKKLKSLTLRFCTVGADGLKPIGQLTNLESLDLLEDEINTPFAEHLRGLTKLRRLDLSGNSISDADMVHLAALTELRDLDIGSGSITAEGLKHIAKLGNLERLLLPRTVANDDLRHVSGLAKLKFLRLISDKITDDGLTHLKPLQNLEELYLPPSITGAGLKHLEGMKRLKRLDFEGDSVTFSQVMKLLVDGQKRSVPEALKVLLHNGVEEDGEVKHLSLDFRPRADKETLKYLVDLPDLEGLSFGKDTTDEWLKSVGSVKKLRFLQFRGDRFNKRVIKISAVGLKELAGCKNLESIEFHDCELGPDALSGIATLPKLKSLQFMDCNLAPGNAAAIGKTSALEALYLSSTNFSDADMRYLEHLDKLKFLALPNGITLKGLTHLKGLKNLSSLQARWEDFEFADLLKLFTEEFRLSTNDALCVFAGLRKSNKGKYTNLEWSYELKASDDDLKILGTLPDLETLSLPQDVTDKGLANLVRLTKLKSLSFNGKMVTDNGMAHLATLENLERLSIHPAPITDNGIKHLVGLKKLTSISFGNSKITDQGITMLQKALPQASIRK